MFAQLRALIGDIDATINGWRFDNLRDQLSSVIVASTKYVPVVREIKHHRTARICFISPLPPQDTGIATCSFYSLFDFPAEVDVFAPNPIWDWMTALEIKANHSVDTVRVYSIEQFLSLDAISNYDFVILAIGNSDHHAYVFDLLKKIGALRNLERVWLLVHDPSVLNLLQCGKSLSNFELFQYLKDLYPDRSSCFASTSIFQKKTWETQSYFAQQGIFGLRAFSSLGIKNYIVNSEAAKAFIENDLDETCTIKKLFHPCFLPLGSEPLEKAPSNDKILVGSFGIPGGSKMTKLVIDTCTDLQKQGREVELFLAGFDVKKFWKNHNFGQLGFKCHLFDGPTDIQLVDMMKKVDIAVQLREENRGESSGIVPMLLMLKKSTIVSNVGAFKEYGKAVHLYENGGGSPVLAELIIAANGRPNVEAINEYTSSHAVSHFQMRLLDAIGSSVTYHKPTGIPPVPVVLDQTPRRPIRNNSNI